jgi:hypothetical protein
MLKTLAPHPFRWPLATVILAALATTATAGAFTRGCAARDMQILMLIEHRESSNAVTEEKMRDAMLTLMHARIVCHEGRVLDALAIYDGIAQSIAPNAVQFSRRLLPEIN